MPRKVLPVNKTGRGIHLMPNEPLLPLHLEFLELQNLRPRSIRERQLGVLRTNTKMGKAVASATEDDIRAWQRTIMHLTPSGQHGEVSHTTQYLRWTYNNGHRADDPTRAIIPPRNVHRSLPRPMSDADVGLALLTAPYPERAWIALGAFCGLRCVEIAAVARADIRDHQSPALLSVVGKGGKHRMIPIPRRVLDEIAAAGAEPRGYLWSRMDGQPGPPSPMRVSERINAHLHAQGISGTAHALRHRFGTMLYRETRDIALVADVMGHASTNTTRMYVLADPVDAANPIAAISKLAGE